MPEILTTRDLTPKRARIVSGTSYFEMHIMLKEQERLEKEKTLLLKRIGQIESRIGQLSKDLQTAEDAMRVNRAKIQ